MKNNIYEDTINGCWSTDPNQIKEEAYRFFRDKFKEKWPSRPKCCNLLFSGISEEHRTYLEQSTSLEEIKADVEKALGPDGFTFNFIKSCLDILFGDIVLFVNILLVTTSLTLHTVYHLSPTTPKVKIRLNLVIFTRLA
uniref:Uncharacterized protein n=1 Tax=Lactuca sativa TaxID=4236 RepID=A0A9R1VEE3_LACSA|nr:hypothetical protein LSAT_V11C500238810 [Lactuca sativa]